MARCPTSYIASGPLLFKAKPLLFYIGAQPHSFFLEEQPHKATTPYLTLPYNSRGAQLYIVGLNLYGLLPGE